MWCMWNDTSLMLPGAGILYSLPRIACTGR